MFMWFGKLALNISFFSWMWSPRAEGKCLLLSPLLFHHNQHTDCLLSFQHHSCLFCIFRYLPWKSIKACSKIFAHYPAIWFPVRILSKDAHTGLGRQKEKSHLLSSGCGRQLCRMMWKTGGSRRLGAVTVELPAVLLQSTEIISIFISISIFLWLMHARSWISLTMPLSNMNHHVNNKLLNIYYSAW